MKLNPKKCLFGVEEGPFLGHLITKQGIKANPSKVKAVTYLDQPKTLKDIQSLNGKLAALSRFLSKAYKVLENIKKLVQALPTRTAPRVGETLTMHLAALKESISVVLAAKRNEGWTPIYFVSRVLQRAELNYPTLEKLVLALVYAIPFEDKEKKEKPKEVPDSNSKWRLYTDGDSNSDGSGAGLMLIDPEGKEYTYDLRFEFETTNNEAEYEALLAGLWIAQEIETAKVAIFLDSQLLVNQIKVTFAAKHTSIKDYLQKVKTALRGFEEYTVEHVRRHKLFKAWKVNNHSKNSSISSKPDGAYICTIKNIRLDLTLRISLIEEDTTRTMAEPILKIYMENAQAESNPIEPITDDNIELSKEFLIELKNNAYH
ncbi:reverse transcriptase domain-containing protein, partial [Tanacetum coccineum]